MENKEAIEILINYFKKERNLDVTYRILANSMIDCVRMIEFEQNLCWIGPRCDDDKKLEFERFMKRMKHNSDEVMMLLTNGDNGKGFSCGQYEAE